MQRKRVGGFVYCFNDGDLNCPLVQQFQVIILNVNRRSSITRECILCVFLLLVNLEKHKWR